MIVGVERLDGWKQIAAFLNKDLRTVQRWEHSEGLPVHRHLHRSQGSVFAWVHELQQWQETRTAGPQPAAPVSAVPHPEPLPESAPVHRPDHRRRALVLSAGATALLIALVFTQLLPRFRSQAIAPGFRQGEAVLVGAFENRTGNALLDGTLPYLLAGEVSRGGWMTAVGRERLSEALTALHLRGDTPIDPALARRIWTAQQSFRVALTGTATREGDRYAFRVQLSDPDTGHFVNGPPVFAENDAAIPEAMKHLADWARKTLGDRRLSEEEATKVAEVTTASPAAAKLFVEASTVRKLGTAEEAAVQEHLLREAIREDEGFASAWHALFWALKNQGKPKSEWLPCLDRAHKLSSGASLRERLQIDADYYMMQRDYAQAVSARRALLQLYPDSPNALRRLILSYEWTGRYEEALSLALSNVTQHPENRVANYVAGLGLSNWAGDTGRARKFADKASALGLRDMSTPPPGYTWADCYGLFQSWAEDRLEALRSGLDALVQRKGPEVGDRRDNLYRFAGMFYLNLGRLRDAKAAFSQLQPKRRAAADALVSFARGEDPPAFNGPHVYPDSALSAILLARSGRIAAAKLARTALESIQGSDGDLTVVDAEILRASGDPRSASVLLTDGLRRLRLSGSPLFFTGSETMAEILLTEGRREEAMDVLRAAVAARSRAYNELGPSGAFWLRICHRLQQLEAESGHAEASAKLLATIRTELRLADADHPLLH